MAVITWNDNLALHQARMDQTHLEFVALLCELESALDGTAATLRDRLAALVDHTDAHFAQEERWMASCGYGAENCHSFQHGHVLQVLREVQRRLVEDEDTASVRLLVPELAQWFPPHAQNMDAPLAETMKYCGLDPETGHMERPITLDAAGGCGSGSCG